MSKTSKPPAIPRYHSIPSVAERLDLSPSLVRNAIPRAVHELDPPLALRVMRSVEENQKA